MRPFVAAARAKLKRLVGIAALATHEFPTGSYSSTLVPAPASPPMAYTRPVTATTPRRARGVSIGAGSDANAGAASAPSPPPVEGDAISTSAASAQYRSRV